MRPLLPTAAAVIALATSSAAGQVEGVVTDADGEPAADVAVLLVEVEDRPGVVNGRLGYLGGADLAATGPDGRFRFARTPADADAGVADERLFAPRPDAARDVRRGGGSLPERLC